MKHQDLQALQRQVARVEGANIHLRSETRQLEELL